jgi:hypothetical protein
MHCIYSHLSHDVRLLSKNTLATGTCTAHTYATAGGVTLAVWTFPDTVNIVPVQTYGMFVNFDLTGKVCLGMEIVSTMCVLERTGKFVQAHCGSFGNVARG